VKEIRIYIVVIRLLEYPHLSAELQLFVVEDEDLS
jgi:hypothetical protein